MTRSSKKLRLFMSAVAVLVLTVSSFADTIRLKDGSIIKGTIVSFAEGRFVIVVGEGLRRRELTLLADEVASIVFEPKTGDNVARRQTPGTSTIQPVSTKPKAADSDTSSDDYESPNAKNPPKVVLTDSTSGSQSAPETASPKPQTQTQQNQTTTKIYDTNTAKNKPSNRSTSSPSQPKTPSTAAPISLNVRVLADATSNGWTNSGWVVKKGQRIRITGSGTVSLGKNKQSPPSGLPDLDDPDKLLKGVPTGALLAVIGDDNNDFIYIGGTREFTAARDGALYLGVNEGNLKDNTGAYDVKIEILPVSEE